MKPNELDGSELASWHIPSAPWPRSTAWSGPWQPSAALASGCGRRCHSWADAPHWRRPGRRPVAREVAGLGGEKHTGRRVQRVPLKPVPGPTLNADWFLKHRITAEPVELSFFLMYAMDSQQYVLLCLCLRGRSTATGYVQLHLTIVAVLINQLKWISTSRPVFLWHSVTKKLSLYYTTNIIFIFVGCWSDHALG